MDHIAVVDHLRDTLLTTMKSVIGDRRPFALIDYPDSANAGDHAIWVGEKTFLKTLGIDAVYECSLQTYDKGALAAALGAGTILMHGGGNFGDTYMYHQFRHQVLADFPDNKIVIFPQTVMFFSDVGIKKSAEVFSAHSDVTIAVRDVLSFHILRKFFDRCQIVLAPDMALMIGPQARTMRAAVGVVWLSRTDAEGVYGASVAATVKLPTLRERSIDLGDFADGIATVACADIAGSELLVTDWYRCTLDQPGIDRYNALDFDQRSQFWVERAVRILSSGRVVITDRLHAHILCTLCGIPHVLLNNNYGKNFSFFETWCRPLDLCKLARSPAEAWTLAQQTLESMATSDGTTLAATDITRWANADNLQSSWYHRSERAAAYVRKNSTLLDVGCGKMMIERLLPKGCRYIPVDVVRRDSRTLICDFNKAEYPPFDGADHISMLGVLEYVNDPAAVWQWLSQTRARLVLSYVPFVRTFPIANRASMGWRNHFRREEILADAKRSGFVLQAEEFIPPDTLLFIFDPRTAAAEEIATTNISQLVGQAGAPRASTQNIRKSPRLGKVGRNEPCPCGSGKKYKYCHGSGAKS